MKRQIQDGTGSLAVVEFSKKRKTKTKTKIDHFLLLYIVSSLIIICKNCFSVDLLQAFNVDCILNVTFCVFSKILYVMFLVVSGWLVVGWGGAVESTATLLSCCKFQSSLFLNVDLLSSKFTVHSVSHYLSDLYNFFLSVVKIVLGSLRLTPGR